MELKNPGAEIFVPDNKPLDEALPRVTHMGISAHEDDIEFMATHGVLEAFGAPDKWFAGVVVTNGAGSPRDDLYASYSDAQMQTVRKLEQKKAAFVGEYGAQFLLDYTSSAVKDPSNKDVVEDLKKVIGTCQPKVIYTHNLADKHDTHVSAALRVIQAVRELPADKRPEKLLGCEVWRDLDWLNDDDKIALCLDSHENIAAALMGVFDSQICGGKRYDLATAGRRRAHATYFASHGVDTCTMQNFAMDLTPLIKDPNLDLKEFLQHYINNFAKEVADRLGKFGK